MDDLLVRMEKAVRASGLLGDPVLVLLSGGRDSVCLLDLAVRVAPRAEALHVNYGLREQADADEAHCRELCGALGVPLHVHGAARAERGGNLQAWARDVRYGVAARRAGAAGAAVAAGHTASDQAETILYRLASSPSRRALLGMQARDGLLVRPLLRFTREDTGAYCSARGLGWREDGSNDDPAYARNRLRRGLLPALREVHPGAEANVVSVAELLRAEAAVLDELVAELLGADGASAGRERLLAASPALARLVVQRLADDVAGGLAPGAARRTAEILALADGGALDVGCGLRARVRKDVVSFEPTPPPAGTPRRTERRALCREVVDPAVPAHRLPPVSDPAIGDVLVAADDLKRRVEELAVEVSRDYAGRDLVLVGVLKGAVFFLSDLMRGLDVQCEVDFMAVASYGSATKSSGVVRILKDLDAVIEDRDVLIVEDIVDSGLTLQYLLRNLGARNPRTLEVCALLTKPERRKVDLPTRYVGFEIPNCFAIGYGLDYRERYRNLPYVAALNERDGGVSLP